MAHRLKPWLVQLFTYAREFEVDVERLADRIIEEFGREVNTTTPPDGGT